jgi:hypothetical protein
MRRVAGFVVLGASNANAVTDAFVAAMAKHRHFAGERSRKMDSPYRVFH